VYSFYYDSVSVNENYFKTLQLGPASQFEFYAGVDAIACDESSELSTTVVFVGLSPVPAKHPILSC
jgi:hypothetical protein